MQNSWFPFLVTTTLVSLSPGVNALAVVQSALQQGFAPTLRVIAGQQLSLATQMVLVAAGLAYLSERVLTGVRLVGAAYLLWVGIGLLRAKVDASQESVCKDAKAPGFWHGYLVNAMNPKALVFQASFVPQFLVIGKPLLGQYALLGAIMLGIELAVMTCYSGFATQAGRWIATASVKNTIERLCGAVFIWLALLMVVAR